MSLASRLARLKPLRAPAVASLDRLESAANQIHARWPEVVPTIPERDQEKVIARLAECEAKGDWRGTKLFEATVGARIVFSDAFRQRREYKRLRDFYIKETQVSESPSFLGGMLAAYIATYKPDAKHTKALADALSGAKHRLRANRQRLVTNLPKLLSPVRAHHAIAERMCSMESPWKGLKALGMQSPNAPGLMDHTHRSFVAKVASRLDREHESRRMIGWLRPEGHEARSTGAVQAVEALLAPWRSRTPEQNLLRYLIDSIVGLYGDPRVSRKHPWGAVSEGTLTVMMRWLTGQSIEFFLDVVSAVEKSHMWEPRRKFWLGLHEKGRIDEAWVAFSKPGARMARELRARADNRDGIAFGIQNGGRPNTSLLVLRLGKCIIVEGSHNYKVHIFRSASKQAPKLFRPTYDCEAIREIPGASAFPHVKRWQERVMEQIEYLS